jgi:hypothetical protein
MFIANPTTERIQIISASRTMNFANLHLAITIFSRKHIEYVGPKRTRVQSECPARVATRGYILPILCEFRADFCSIWQFLTWHSLWTRVRFGPTYSTSRSLVTIRSRSTDAKSHIVADEIRDCCRLDCWREAALLAETVYFDESGGE